MTPPLLTLIKRPLMKDNQRQEPPFEGGDNPTRLSDNKIILYWALLLLQCSADNVLRGFNCILLCFKNMFAHV